jgi:hypothetical protein
MIFQSSMGPGKSRCDIPSGTTQGQNCFLVLKLLLSCLYVAFK